MEKKSRLPSYITRNKECEEIFFEIQQLNEDLLDLIIFDFLTADEELQNLIRFCKEYRINREKLMDQLKESAVDVKNLNIDVELELDLVEPREAFKGLSIADKSLILFMIFEEYPSSFKANLIDVAVGRILRAGECLNDIG